jgi:hypothetical protein
LQKEGFQVYGYADDSQLGKWIFLNTLRDLIINALKTLQIVWDQRFVIKSFAD